MSGPPFVTRDARAVMAPGRPASAAPLPRCRAGGATGQKAAGGVGNGRDGRLHGGKRLCGGHLRRADGAAIGPWVPARRNGRRTRCVYLLEGLFPGRPCPAPGPEALRWARSCRQPHEGSGMGPAGRLAMAKAETGSRSPVLEEAARKLEAAAYDGRVAVDCLALGELDRAHTSALTAQVAADAAVTALQAALLAAGTAAGS